MIDLNHIARYQENNRIEAKKAAGGFPPQPVGDLFRLCQHHRRSDPAGGGGGPGQNPPGHRHPGWSRVCTSVLADGAGPRQGQRQHSPAPGCHPPHHCGQRGSGDLRAPGRAAPAASVHWGQPLYRRVPPGRRRGLSLFPRRGPGHAAGPGRRPRRPGGAGEPWTGSPLRGDPAPVPAVHGDAAAGPSLERPPG